MEKFARLYERTAKYDAGSYEKRIGAAKREAINAVANDDYEMAINYCIIAISLKEAAAEAEYQHNLVKMLMEEEQA